ncbi:protein kinase domain-containing protein [Nocardia asteroides]|uniref:protein kinase domain-containing protein n=1 Tax=Nocardia asteroides TaxID=1824 RepID=UPI003656A78A
MSGDSLEPGTRFAGYTIEGTLGSGGMGTVYAARHPTLPRTVALKVLHPALTGDDDVRTRFELEADHAARLDHPAIVAVYDRGREGNRLWIAMQLVPGTDAARLLRDGPVEPDRAVRIIESVAAALDYAHRAEVFHRDVNPANILLAAPAAPDEPERVLLTDFGIAKALDDTVHLTAAGTLVATLRYAAPEQIEGRTVDHRADQYSLGCTLFHLLTGAPPYPGPSRAAIMNGHLNGPIPRPGDHLPTLPRGLEPVFARAMAKRPDDRYPTCAEFASAARSALAAADRPTAEYPAPQRSTGQCSLRVVLADDSALLRQGIARLLEDEGMEVAGQASDAMALLRLVRAHRPDVAVIDIRMPPTCTTEGIDAAVAIRRDYPGTAVLLLSQYIETENVLDLLSGGARSLGYLLKDRVADIDEFVTAVRRVAAGGSAIDPDLVGRLVSRPHHGALPLDDLSPREREVLRLMAEGRSNRAIGAALFLGERTIETHVRGIFAKLGLQPEPDDHRRVLAVLTHLRLGN